MSLKIRYDSYMCISLAVGYLPTQNKDNAWWNIALIVFIHIGQCLNLPPCCHLVPFNR